MREISVASSTFCRQLQRVKSNTTVRDAGFAEARGAATLAFNFANGRKGGQKVPLDFKQDFFLMFSCLYC